MTLGLLFAGSSVDRLWADPALSVLLALGYGGFLLLAAATSGLVFVCFDRLSPVIAIIGSVSAMCGFLVVAGTSLVVLWPIGTAAVVANLAHAGVLGRRLSAIHVASALGFVVPIVLGLESLWNVFLVFMVPLALTWVAIGVRLVRAYPTTEHAPGT